MKSALAMLMVFTEIVSNCPLKTLGRFKGSEKGVSDSALNVRTTNPTGARTAALVTCAMGAKLTIPSSEQVVTALRADLILFDFIVLFNW